MNRRQFLQIAIPSAASLAFSPRLALSQLESKVLTLTPLKEAKKPSNRSRNFPGVYYTLEDLSQYYRTKEEIVNANKDLKKDSSTEFIALDPGKNFSSFRELPPFEDFIRSLSGIEMTIGLTMPPENYGQLPIIESSCPESFFSKSYSLTKNRPKVLEAYRNYVQQFSNLLNSLGFNMYLSLNPSYFQDSAELLTREWLAHSKVNTVLDLTSLSLPDSTLAQILKEASFVLSSDTERLKRLGFKGRFVVKTSN